LATLPNNPGNCFSGDRDPVNGAPGSASTDPPGIEINPAYQPTNGLCTTPNAGDLGPLLFEANCASQLLAPCPSVQTAVCSLAPSPCPFPPTPSPATNYPRPDARFTLHMPPAQTTMPNPCVNVPANPWCPKPGPDGPATTQAATPVVATVAALGTWAIAGRLRSRRRRTAA
jgi:hypothetical protein